MTCPPFRTLPLLVQTLAAALLCPVAFAKPKASPPKQTETEMKPVLPASNPPRTVPRKTKDQKQAEVRAAVAAGKAAGKKSAPSQPVPAKGSTPAAAKNLAQTSPPKAQPQTQGDKSVRKGEAAPSPKFALIADPAELLSRVPASGPLGEEHLILHAIATDPLLERRRASIATARADKRAQQDWENPELRLSYASQDDNYVRRPYTERSIEQYFASETSTGTDSTMGPLSTITDNNSGITDTNRYRETVRTITPLKNGGERVVTDVYELRTENGISTRDREITDATGSPISSGSDILADRVTRQLTSHSYEDTTSSRRGNGSTFTALIRFKIPNHWERKARIQRASAEISLAEAQYLAEEDKLVREVRERYEILSTLEGISASHSHIRDTYSNYRKTIEGLESQIPENAPDYSDFVEAAFRAGLDVHKTQMDIFKTDAEIDRTRAELARFCGLSDPSRIRSGSMARRLVDPNSLDADYLVELGMIYRADAVESLGRLAIAKAHLAEVQAAKIPWASFLDAGWTRESADDSRGNQDELTVRIGFNFPLWEWTGLNKKSKEYKNAAAAWETQFEKQKQRVHSDVDLAIRRLRTASTLLQRHDKVLSELRTDAGKSLPKIEKLMKKPGDLAKFQRTKFEYEVRIHDTEIGRFNAYSEYNQALMFLEDAIGVRIEKALQGVQK